MATSGSTDFDLTRNEIIVAALRKIGAVAQGESPTAEMISEGAEALNVITKNIDEFRLWKREWWTKTLSSSDKVTGSDAKIYTCIRTHVSALDNKPVSGANYKTYWKEMGSTGGTWEASTTYNAIGQFSFDNDIIGVERAFIRYAGSDIPLKIMGFADYMDVAKKDDLGQPHTLYIEKTKVMSGYFVPQPDKTDYILNALVYKKLEDFDTASNNPDFLAKWLRYLIYELAAELGPEYGINMATQRYLDAKAELYRGRLIESDQEASDGSFVKPCF